MIKIFSILAPLMLYTGLCIGQDTTGQRFNEQMDIKDWIGKHRKHKNNTGENKFSKNNFMLLMPVIASNPTAGLMYGVGLSYTFKTFSTDQKLSTISGNLSNSTKGLLNLNVRSNVFAWHEKWLLNGDWRFLSGTETTYGLGTTTHASSNTYRNGYEIGKDKLGQSLSFNHARFRETVSRKIAKNFFAGIGFQYDYFYSVKDQLTAVGDSANSIQYQYSRKHGFNPSEYTVSGLSINLLYDNRDNEVNTYKGYYANINYAVNTTLLGSSANSSALMAEYRVFYPLDHKKKNILAFWLYGNFLTSGKLPYLALPALGYDQRQRSGRGYTFGRFRGEDILYGESEYRFPVSPHSGILGGVLFVNVTSVADKQTKAHLADAFRVAYGTGLRIMLDKKSRTRLEIDVGTAQKEIGFYFGVQETF